MKKSVGFNWGTSAVSTTYWTGFRLCDLLKHCGARTPLDGAKYVHFKGVSKELPQVLGSPSLNSQRQCVALQIHSQSWPLVFRAPPLLW